MRLKYFLTATWRRTLGLSLRREATVKECLKRPEISAADIASVMGISNDEDMAYKALAQLEIETKYAGYIKRQEDEIEKSAGMNRCRSLRAWTF